MSTRRAIGIAAIPERGEDSASDASSVVDAAARLRTPWLPGLPETGGWRCSKTLRCGVFRRSIARQIERASGQTIRAGCESAAMMHPFRQGSVRRGFQPRRPLPEASVQLNDSSFHAQGCGEPAPRKTAALPACPWGAVLRLRARGFTACARAIHRTRARPDPGPGGGREQPARNSQGCGQRPSIRERAILRQRNQVPDE